MAKSARMTLAFILMALFPIAQGVQASPEPDAGADQEVGTETAYDEAHEARMKSDSGSGGAGAQSSGGGSFGSNKSKLEVHGFLSQAYASGDFVGNRFPGPGGVDPGPTFDELALGIPEDGTFNYRNMALQFRYEISPKDIMIVQLSSRALGNSPINELEDEVELDWAFYERRLTDNTSVKVGRVQIPLGIFNEIRDVGTILPFYRPAFLFYREGSFTSETVDGIVLSHTFAAESDWSLESDFFFGRWESVEQNPFAQEGVALAENEGYGLQLWLNTPLPGLRFGLGGHERDVTGGAEGVLRLPGETSRFDDAYFSVDGVFNRFTIRGEWRQFQGDREASPVFAAPDFTSIIDSYYVQAGVNLGEHWRIFVQYEKTESELKASSFPGDFDVSLRDDTGIAVNYVFNPNLVLKAEYHEVGGEDLTFFPTFGPGGVTLNPLIQDLDEGNYFITSLSVSF